MGHISTILSLDPFCLLFTKPKLAALVFPVLIRAISTNIRPSRSIDPPAEMAILPGVIDVTTNYLEHPEVVADRICHRWTQSGSRRDCQY